MENKFKITYLFLKCTQYQVVIGTVKPMLKKKQKFTFSFLNQKDYIIKKIHKYQMPW